MSPISCFRSTIFAFAGIALSLATPAEGQSPDGGREPLPQLVPIAEAIRDANGDTVPDLLGRKVRVQGVVTIGSGVMSEDRLQVYFQDHTAGTYVFSMGWRQESIPAGTLIEVRGTLQQYKGAVQIARPVVTQLGKRPLPPPLDLTVRQAASWKHYGRLATVEGTVGAGADQGPYVGYDFEGEGTSIRLLMPPSVAAALGTVNLNPGAKVRVTGVVSIYSPSVPHNDGFQLIVASPEWVRVVSTPMPEWIRSAGYTLAALTLVVLLILVLLKLRRRSSDKRKRHSSLVTELSALAAGVVDEEAFLKRAVELLVTHEICEASMVHLVEGRNLRLIASYGFDAEKAHLVDDFIQSRVAGCLGDARVTEGGRVKVVADDSPLDGLSCLPLQGRSRTLGVLTGVARSHSDLGAAEMTTLEAAANLLALGIENVHAVRANEEKQRELEQLAVSDPLTGLYNRRFMDEYLRIHLAMARRQNAPVSFIAIDLDHFKPVNDTYGHEAGDQVLAEIGGLVRANARASDLPVRLGGEEFLLIMPGTDEAGAMTFAMRLQDAFRAHEYSHLPSDIRITASFGIAIYPEHGDAARLLLRAADEAMYTSKREGRNRITVARAEPHIMLET